MAEFNKGDTIIITNLNGRTRRMIKVGDTGVLSKQYHNGYWYAWIAGFECYLGDNTTFELFNNKKMENTDLAKVIYRNTVDEHIEILRFKNILSEKEIKEKFGEEVARVYLYGGAGMAFKRANESVIFCRKGSNISIGLISKNDFQERIEYLKKCGARLGEIRKQVEEEKYTKEHVITI